MRRLLFLSFVCFSSSALAQNPGWPNRDATPEEMRDPANWPDDPSYGYDIDGDGESCIGDGLRCWTNSNGGQWNLWSWVPPALAERDTFRTAELDQPAGMSADLAWQMTTGDGRVVIAVLDSGINWDERDLTNQLYHQPSGARSPRAGLAGACRRLRPGTQGIPSTSNGDGFLEHARLVRSVSMPDEARGAHQLPRRRWQRERHCRSR